MNSRIEDFVRDNREEFDSEEPDHKIWDKIAANLEPRKKKQGILVGIGRAGWIAAAAVVLLAVGMVWVLSTRSGHDAPAVASQATNHLPAQGAAVTKTEPATTPKETVDSTHAGIGTQATPQPTLATIRPKDNNQPQAKVNELENSMDEEMYHYAKLVK